MWRSMKGKQAGKRKALERKKQMMTPSPTSPLKHHSTANIFCV